MKTVSIIIPCYRSEKTIAQVVAEIDAAFAAQSAFDYRVILVNDASPDATLAAIRSVYERNHRVCGLDLARNFGQQSARMAALPFVQGDYVVFMDDDGQHPAAGIFAMLEKLEAGFDIAYAHFGKKQHSALQRVGSKVNKAMTEWLIGKPKDVTASSFFAVKAFVAQALQQYNSPSPYIFGYLMQITRNICEVPMEHRQRLAGTSGYTFGKLLRLWMNGFTSFSVKPLRISSLLGVLCAMAGFIFGLVIIINKIMNPAIAAGYSSTMAVLMFIGGVLMLLLGMLGEYVGRIFLTLNSLPQFVVREILVHKENSGAETTDGQ